MSNESNLSTDGFAMNLCAALLRVCEPFTYIPIIDP